jgi:arylsulfatase A-like enzyme
MYWKTNQAYAVRDGQWKLILHRNSNTAELFDLKNDFRETQDVSKNHPDKVEEMMTLLESFQRDDRSDETE